MTISARDWGVPAQAFAGTGTVLSVAPGKPAGLDATDISVLTVQVSPTDATITPPAGWTPVGGGVVNTRPNKAGPDSFAVMFICKGSLEGTATDVSASRTGGAGWLKAQIASYSKTTAPDWSYSTTIDDYTYGANSISGTGLFLTLESNVSVQPVQSLYTDDFDELDLDNWFVYDGPGRGGKGLRLPSNVSTVGGALTIVGTPDGKTGGVRLRKHGQQYGQWEFRARAKLGASYYRPVVRLWEVDGGDGDDNVYGSINILEVVRSANRAANTFSVNYDAGGPQHLSSEFTVDMTQWHVYSLTWSSGGVFFYVDGQLAWLTYNTAIQPVGAADLCILLEYYESELVATSDKRRETPNYLAASFEVDYVRQTSLAS